MDSSTGMSYLLNQIPHTKLGYESENIFVVIRLDLCLKLQKVDKGDDKCDVTTCVFCHFKHYLVLGHRNTVFTIIT